MPARRIADHRPRGFTLVDVLITVTIIGVLIAILLPTISGVQETARRVACRSNVRQIGLGVSMYADAHAGFLPPSVFLPFTQAVATEGSRLTAGAQPQQMVTLRLGPEAAQSMIPSASLAITRAWDGLGILYQARYQPAEKVFYCPSHKGESPFINYAKSFGDDSGEIVGNYHYRGFGYIEHASGRRDRTNRLYLIEPAKQALIADGMRTQSDTNHVVGTNLFRADLSVVWFSDPGQTLQSSLPDKKEDAVDPGPVEDAWSRFDQGANPTGTD